jgi:hypothetical protein
MKLEYFGLMIFLLFEQVPAWAISPQQYCASTAAGSCEILNVETSVVTAGGNASNAALGVNQNIGFTGTQVIAFITKKYCNNQKFYVSLSQKNLDTKVPSCRYSYSTTDGSFTVGPCKDNALVSGDFQSGSVSCP